MRSKTSVYTVLTPNSFPIQKDKTATVASKEMMRSFFFTEPLHEKDLDRAICRALAGNHPLIFEKALYIFFIKRHPKSVVFFQEQLKHIQMD